MYEPLKTRQILIGLYSLTSNGPYLKIFLLNSITKILRRISSLRLHVPYQSGMNIKPDNWTILPYNLLTLLYLLHHPQACMFTSKETC